jgi:hypothetical protein
MGNAGLAAPANAEAPGATPSGHLVRSHVVRSRCSSCESCGAMLNGICPCSPRQYSASASTFALACRHRWQAASLRSGPTGWQHAQLRAPSRMGDDPSDVSISGYASQHASQPASRLPARRSLAGPDRSRAPTASTSFSAPGKLLTAAGRAQVASRKVKQLIVLVDKMEQAQSALELKLRGTEVCTNWSRPRRGLFRECRRSFSAGVRRRSSARSRPPRRSCPRSSPSPT